MENSKRDNRVSKFQKGLGCSDLSISFLSFWLEFSVPVFSQDFLSVMAVDAGIILKPHKALVLA